MIYTGAPQRAFIGHAVLQQGTHEWTPDEAGRYPGDFTSGVTFSESHLWERPIPIMSILPNLHLGERNPQGTFRSGVVRIQPEDFEKIVGVAQATAPLGSAVPSDPAAPRSASASRPTMAAKPPPVDERRATDALFEATERLRGYLERGSTDLSEEGTRSWFIDKYLDALGYNDFEDIEYGSAMVSGNFPDYVLRVNGQPAIALEAKKVGHALGAKEAGQLVQYCSGLGSGGAS